MLFNFDGFAGDNLLCDSSQQVISDSFDFNDLTPQLMQDITNDVANLFGRVCPDAFEIPVFNNMAMYSTLGEGLPIDNDLLYNPNFMWHIANEYGNETIFGVIAHELGHQINNEIVLQSGVEIDSWQNELCSDFLSGVYMRLANMDCNGMSEFFSKEAWEESESHPGGAMRSEAFMSGYNWADNNVFAQFEIKGNYPLVDVLKENILNKYAMPEIINDISLNELGESSLKSIHDGLEGQISFGLGLCNIGCLQNKCASADNSASADYAHADSSSANG